MSELGYIQYGFPMDLIYSLPFQQILYNAKKNHIANSRQMEKEVEILSKQNKDEIIDLLTNYMIKAMEEDVKLGNVSDSTVKEIGTRIDYLNSQFRDINDYFENMDIYDQRKLLLPFIEKELNNLINFKDKFKQKINSKPKWNDNDSIMYTYYSLYLENMAVYRKILKTASRERIKGVLNAIKIMLLYYKAVLLVYVLGKPLKNEVVLERLSELRSNINPSRFYITSSKHREIIDSLSKVAPIS
jgi:hypothetical protein